MLHNLGSYSQGSSTTIEIMGERHIRCRLVHRAHEKPLSSGVEYTGGGELHRSTHIDGSCDQLMPGAQWDEMDAQAEREAEAVAWFGTALGVATQRHTPLFETLLSEPISRDYRNHRAALRRAMERINAHFAKRLRGEPSIFKGKKEIRTRGDLERWAKRRLTRLGLLLALQNEPAQYVRRKVAVKLAGMGERTLDRAVAEKRIHAIRHEGRLLVSVDHLKAYLQKKVG